MRRIGLVTTASTLTLALALLGGCGSSSKSTTPTTAASGGATTTTTAAAGGTTVNVVVSDTKGLGGPMTTTADKTMVPAGDVTFVVKNTGTIDHETVVLKLKAGETYNGLKITGFDNEPNRVDEASSVGETGDPALKPGETRAFTVKNMVAGSYALVCNIAKHYGLGMRAAFTVS